MASSLVMTTRDIPGLRANSQFQDHVRSCIPDPSVVFDRMENLPEPRTVENRFINAGNACAYSALIFSARVFESWCPSPACDDKDPTTKVITTVSGLLIAVPLEPDARRIEPVCIIPQRGTIRSYLA